MTKTKKLLALLLAVVMVLGLLPAVAYAEEAVFYTLTPASGSNNSYDGNCDVTIDGIIWNITGNSQMQPWRIGGGKKNGLDAVDRTVYSKTAMGSSITKVGLTVGEATSITVNSLKLIVSSDASFSNQLDVVTKTFEANSTIEFTPTSGTSWAKDAYYKFVFNVTVAKGSNRFVEFTEAKFYHENSGDPTPSYTVTAASNNTVWGTVELNGSVITATPAEGYYVADATVSPDGAATVTQNGNTFTVSDVTANCTITVNFAAKTPVTVTYDGNGATGGTAMADETVYKEDKYTVKDSTYTREGYDFVGWTIDGGDNTLYTAGDEIDLTGDTDFLAQWEEAVPVTIDTYNKISDATQLTNGTYLFVAVLSESNKLFNGTSSAAGNFSDVEIENNTIVGNYAASEIVITAMDDGYSLKNSENKYLKSPGSNGIAFADDATANTIEFSGGVASISSVNDEDRVLQLNRTANPQYFRYYAPNNAFAKITLFKKVVETAFTVTAEANNDAYGTVVLNDDVITATPAEGYYVAGATVSPEGAATVTQNGNTFTVSDVTANCTITVNFAAKTPVTVTYDGNGATGGTAMADETVYKEDKYTVKDSTYTRDGYDFVGWTIDGGDNTLYTAGDEIDLTGDTDFLAQWEEVVASRTAGLMASAPADGDHVVIHNTQYNKALGEGGKAGSGNHYNEGVDKTPVEGVIYDVTDSIIWDVTKVSDGVYKFSQNGKFLSMAASYSSTPYDEANQEWAVAAYENGYSIQNTGTQKYLEWYASKNYFSGFSPISNNGMFEFLFYKVDAEPETIEKCTVTFDAGTGTGSMAPVEVIKGASYSLPANDGFTAPEGYAFDGWTIGGGDGTVLEVGASVTIEEDTTFIAHYSNNTRTYQLVTSENQLAAGGKYIMVGVDDNDAAWALSKISGNNKYREIVGVTVDGSIITVANSDVAAAASDLKVFELTLGGSAANGWTFHDGFSGYLCATSSSSNDIGVQTDADTDGMSNRMFTVMIDADGKVHAIANGDKTRNQILYNFSSPRFSCYEKPSASNTKYFYLYKLVDPMPDGYYLVCDKTDWIPDPMQQFTVNPGANGEYMLNTTLGVGDEIKVVGVQNGVQTWYPDGMNNNYVISDENAGDVTIYFRPDGQGNTALGWHYGYIYIADYDFFKTQNLVLSELIGVQFFLDLSVLSPEEKAASYMTFSITGRGKNDLKTTRVDFADASTNGKGYRGFLCKVNALQMADTITATFHYGDGLTATKDYSVKAYIDKWEVKYNNGETGLSGDELTRTNDLIRALADYGHYVQPFLATYHGFTIGEGENDYAAMDTYYTDSYDPTTLNKDNYPMTVSGDDTVFGNPTMSLKLDSKTSIRVYLNPAENKDFAEGFSVTVKKGETTLTENEDFTVTKTGNRYMVEITGVKASELTTMYTIEATNGDKTQTVSAFALTYVGRLLSSETYKDNGQAIAAVCALWNYGILASNY